MNVINKARIKIISKNYIIKCGQKAYKSNQYETFLLVIQKTIQYLHFDTYYACMYKMLLWHLLLRFNSSIEPCHIKTEDIKKYSNSRFHFKCQVLSFSFNLIPNSLLYGQNYYSYVGLKNSTQKSTFWENAIWNLTLW